MIELRPYQSAAIEALRIGVREGHKRQILYAPTGAGKTEMAMALVQEAERKLTRTAFIVDRVALCDQTSARYGSAGIEHGVIQADHWRWRPYERHQICTVQTLMRRGLSENTSLIVVDEAHTMYRMTTEFLKRHPEVVTIGLTATPFTRGMGALFSNVVNSATTDKLIDDGYLVPLKVYVGKAADMTGAKTKFDGEWQESEIESRGVTIIGDIVSEWLAKTTLHFGEQVKTIVFSATVAHGEELCKRFQDAGFNFQQVSYRDGNDEKRRALIEEFRSHDSEITGLVSCEALAKGFDVPDIMCGISARPYRKSLSGHIQQIGRAMRPFPGKNFALWLDHSNNCLRFHEDTLAIFSTGIAKLDDGSLDAKVRKEPSAEEKAAFACGSCKYLMGGARHCPACGWERPKTRSDVREVVGELHALEMSAKAQEIAHYLRDKDAVWRQLCGLGLERKKGDIAAARKFALAQYKNLYNSWPAAEFDHTNVEEPNPMLLRKVQQGIIAWAKRRNTQHPESPA